jgi:iron complex outermembrane receptor protein
MGTQRKTETWILLTALTAGTAVALTAETADAADEAADSFLAGPAQVVITASRLGDGLIGTDSTVVTAQDIAADPATDLPAILSRQAGLQLQSLFGGVNGAEAAIGLRGFGATATENTLVLVNGRRINDPDQSNIDFSAIPAASIERVEITRGNSAAVLYGDGAVGGVINIITRNGDNSQPATTIDTSLGSFQYRALDLSTTQKVGGTSISAYGTEIVSNGYRDNNALRERNFDGEIRQTIAGGEIYLNIRGDDQYLGLPGSLPINQWIIAPKSTNNPLDYGGLQSVNATIGVTQRLGENVELILDGGIRHKEEQSEYNAFAYFYGIDVTTVSLTPRLTIGSQISGMSSKLITGIDLYQSFYRSFESVTKGAIPYQNNLLDQRSLAIYGEESLALAANTNLGFGLRLQRTNLTARQKVDQFAPGYYGEPPGNPLTQTDDDYAAHLGLEQNLGQEVTLFGRIGHAMRLPNMDDRNYVAVYPTNFELKTQTSEDVEIGLQAKWGRLSGQTRLYAMNLHNEIDYDPGANGGLGANVNLAPTQRKGWETELTYEIAPEITVNANGSVTDASFRSGPYKGLEVPQISLLSGNLGAAWSIWRNFLVWDADLRAVGKRRLGDDFLGTQPMVPGSSSIDMKISGVVEQFHWSLSAQNLLDSHSFDLGFTGSGGTGVYPLPGRNVIGRVGVTF